MSFIILTILLIATFAAELALGSVSIPIHRLWEALIAPQEADTVSKILWTFRIPKACAALLAGVALSVCGVQMQTLFRNPLADPYILGISSGAGLGVALFVMGFSTGLTLTLLFDLGIVFAAFCGALVVSFLMIWAAKRVESTLSLIILGIMIGSVGSAFISLLQYFSSASELKMYVMWTMGSFSNVTGVNLWIMAVLVVAGIVISILNIKELNVILMGEGYAKSLGINLVSLKRRLFVSTALLAGSITAFCGPIGFIGIAVPHLARMIFKNANHKVLIPSSALLGAVTMLLADLISQLPGSGSILPINTVTALIGIPVIIVIILQNRGHEQ
ncbi:MAG: iron ABC transporter permease [Prevotellaceae bacterium]|nr:iron ABC transporter permease [Prevotellaceae bacterium]